VGLFAPGYGGKLTIFRLKLTFFGKIFCGGEKKLPITVLPITDWEYDNW
jgi:hypothetical protein